MKNNSAIRMMFEEGNKLAAKYGRENVFDFSLGNPSVPAPAEVNQAIQDIVKEEDSLFVHGYMSNAGYEDVRETIAQSLNRRFGTSFHAGNILMTVGAASGLNVILRTGPYTMLIKLYARDNEHLMELLNAQIQEIPGVTATETLISLRQSVKREIPICDISE